MTVELKVRDVTITFMIITIIMFVGGCEIIKLHKQRNDSISMYNSFVDSLKVERDKNGAMTAKIATIEEDNIDLFLQAKTNDRVIKRLQEQVKKYINSMTAGSSVTVFSTETNAHVDARLTSTGESDFTDSLKTNTEKSFSMTQLDDWIAVKGSITNDSVHVDIKVRHDFSVVVGHEKTGFLGLGKRRSFCEITDSNPYDTIKSLRTYQVKVPSSSTFKVMGIGIGIGVIGTLILLK